MNLGIRLKCVGSLLERMGRFEEAKCSRVDFWREVLASVVASSAECQ